MPLDNDAASEKFPWEKSYPKDLRWDADIPEKTLVELFDEAVKSFPDRTCIDFMDKTYTYRELGEMVDRFAKGLQDQGIGKGSKVGLSLPNMPFYPIAYYGALKTGATVVNFNPLYKPEEMEYQIKDSDVDMMIGMNLKLLYPGLENLLGTAKFKKLVVCNLADVLPGVKGPALKLGNKYPSKLSWLAKKTESLKKKLPVKLAPLDMIADLNKQVSESPFAHIKKDKNILSFSDLLKSKGTLKPVEIHPGDIAVLQYTGGTTGKPKAAILTHDNVAANTQQTKLWFATGAAAKREIRALAILPFYHVFSMTVMMNLPLHMGGQIIMLPKFDPKETLKTMTDKKPTIFAGIPELYSKLNKELAANPKPYNTSSLDVCISGAAPLPEETAKEFKKYAGIDLLEGYGLSESSAAALANPVYGKKKTGTIGLPMPRTEVKLVPLPEDQSKLDSSLPGPETPVEVKGEICLRGPQIMKGYWKRSEQTAETIDKDGWLHTGDVGQFDKDGYLKIVGRLKDMIIVNGLKVWPTKVEDVAFKNEAIEDVAVIGLPDPVTGEKVAMYFVTKPGKSITREKFEEFMRERLSGYEIPKIYEQRESLPKTALGKPDKKTLKQEVLAKIAAAEAEAAKSAPVKKNNGPQV